MLLTMLVVIFADVIEAVERDGWAVCRAELLQLLVGNYCESLAVSLLALVNQRRS